MKMKKLFAIAVMMLGMVNTYAQVDGTFQFVDASGNVVADGSTVTFSEVEPGIPGLIADQIKFNLFVKNTLNEEAYVAARLVTEELPSGSVQFCFPEQCQNGELPKDYTSDGGTVSANEKKPLNSEWNLENGKYGTARFTLQILVMDRSGRAPKYEYSLKANGPKITINCIYADPSGIADMESDKNATVISRYDSKGNKLSAPVKGLNIIKLSNGKTVKTIIK